MASLSGHVMRVDATPGEPDDVIARIDDETACVVVCPEQAIISGDLDDRESPIARIVAGEQVQVRKAEQGTRPKVFYVGADTAALTPSLQTPEPTYMWAQRPAEEVHRQVRAWWPSNRRQHRRRD